MKQFHKPELDERIRGLLDVRNPTGGPTPQQISDEVVKTLDVADILGTVKHARTTGTATARNDQYEVPEKKRWRLLHASIVRAETGTNDFYLSVDGTTAYLDRLATAVFSKWEPKTLFYIQAGHKVGCQSNTGTSGTITSDLVYIEQDIGSQ